jgi:anti-sigma regulatory factor (Ser/Thr protein kinase)
MLASMRPPDRSATKPPAVRWSGTATPEAVGHVRRLLVERAAHLGAGQDLIDRLALAVTEALSNVVLHAYRGTPAGGAVRVAMERREARLHVAVHDEGVGLVPRTDSPGLGLGLGLMAQSADAFDVRTRPAGRGVEVRLEFSLAA